MSDKIVVVISSGERAKAATGLMYATNALGKGWMSEVKIIFFGPAQELIAKDEEMQAMIAQIAELDAPVACKFISDRDGYSDKLEAAGLKVEYIGSMLSDLIKDGYVPLVF